ncbi:MAG: DUF1294 domain-containing protein [Candidatus Methanoplasma sp.]|jgi:uncharacterized membrane protein YsdA (DUF1294 family)|nr:DUF1294 domain-containing protein [Candidatus Methanoplasma sp.]
MILGPAGLAAVLYIILNGVSFFLFWSDKRKAIKDRYRIKESTLIISGVIGPFGAFAGMRIFRHKTRKTKFKLIYLFMILHLILIAYLIWKYAI